MYISSLVTIVSWTYDIFYTSNSEYIQVQGYFFMDIMGFLVFIGEIGLENWSDGF